MSPCLKIKLIGIYFIFVYIISLLLYMNVEHLTEYNKLTNIIFECSFIVFVIGIIYIVVKNKIFYSSIIIKIVFFTVIIMIYFIIEQSIIKLMMYGIGGTGGVIRNTIYNNFEYLLSWKEVLFWNFIYSLHYPIYIFIFFKPFVNHLDKSIREIREEQESKNQ